MKAFMDRDFLLENETARTLFHKYAENQPIYDYHNHLPPREIAERKQYENLTQLWLAADHYKWRAMRACGVDEQYITGDAPEYEKFQKWAEVVPQLVGCPLYHWTHLELQRYFEIDTPLTSETAPAIWAETKEKLKAYDAVSLLEKMNVRVLCTTDDPADTLEWHKKIAADPTIPFRVLPSFRPDKYLGGNPDAERALCEKYGTDSVPEALEKALDYFCENGCKVSDHGFSKFAYVPGRKQAELLHVLGKAYHAHGVAMQLHTVGQAARPLQRGELCRVQAGQQQVFRDALGQDVVHGVPDPGRKPACGLLGGTTQHQFQRGLQRAVVKADVDVGPQLLFQKRSLQWRLVRPQQRIQQDLHAQLAFPVGKCAGVPGQRTLHLVGLRLFGIVRDVHADARLLILQRQSGLAGALGHPAQVVFIQEGQFFGHIHPAVQGHTAVVGAVMAAVHPLVLLIGQRRDGGLW